MLEGLDEIDWAKLTHAYGSAEDVPGLIRGLLVAAPSHNSGPLYELFGNIWHQGTIFEATAFAVPFLTELAVSPQTPDQAGVLQLLASIAEGASYREVRHAG